MKQPAVSVVIPAYNEEENIQELLRRTTEALKKSEKDFEIILVDDGSQDRTFSIAKKIAQENSRITVLKHQCKKGKSLSLRSGFKYARGKIVVMMDADLQYDPHEIRRLLEPIKEGYDVVNGCRDFDKYAPTRTILSKIYNTLTEKVLGESGVHDLNCGFKAFRREVAKRLIREFTWWEGIHRYLITLCALLGYKITEVKVSLKIRRYGHSKYGIRRIVNGLTLLLFLFMRIKLLGNKK
jgi:glycosyltransferase involved in cell wall biosynthesis